MTESEYEPTARRPIKSRNTRWAEWTTNRLVAMGVTPNAISVFGMVAAISAGIAFSATSFNTGSAQRFLWLVGGLLCQVRLLCNLFDGMVAVERNVASAKGELYNEVPDRISDSAIMIGLGYSIAGVAALGYLAALVSVFVAYVRAMGCSIGAPNDFCGPMAKPQRMALATAVAIYLVFAPASWEVPWGAASWMLVLVALGGAVTAMRRLARTANYLERAVK